MTTRTRIHWLLSVALMLAGGFSMGHAVGIRQQSHVTAEWKQAAKKWEIAAGDWRKAAEAWQKTAAEASEPALAVSHGWTGPSMQRLEDNPRLSRSGYFIDGKAVYLPRVDITKTMGLDPIQLDVNGYVKARCYGADGKPLEPSR